MKYGYARVSTRGQDLNSQIEKLKQEHCDTIYAEKMTGTTAERPEFQRLLNTIESGDTLVVTKLDRFARSTQEALTIIKDLFERDVKIDILNLGRIENTPSGRLIFTVFSAFADFERDLIIERTQEGKAIAKQNPNFREGRPKKFSKTQLEHALKLLNTHSYKQVYELTGISKTTLWRYKESKVVVND
ncbi:recombinase family protein [Alkalibacterium olivapovliticus]|uniref:DNA invertase Pin-like site-specific DNA recombinase n=1 Tax=Alkalibacterium olivapovliticus TaxID=99907 RepID=A0A2T0W8L1_9LACT|nr:recombinase family protein [Alkalibacterium olivapovliticus]PRY82874.1 DNA invertase Pin-like site-specific DNA recombinase [Alkalibacterium olivapovliticus]